MAKVCPTCEKEYGDDVLYCSADGCTLQSLTIGDDLVGTVVADRYLITDMVGEGGMGRVYLARHVRLPQNVAVKVLHPWLVRDANVVTRFRREAVNASQIENEHVARVFDHGEIGDGLLYIAMEFVEGKPLGEIVARNGPLSIPRAIEITRQVAEALAAAHERPTPIVHRDLKPDNILLGVRRDGSDRAKVVDFGIAEAMSGGGPKLTQQGLVIGTPEYMSPEQLSASSLDWRSDIYSLALVTFYMLTGLHALHVIVEGVNERPQLVLHHIGLQRIQALTPALAHGVAKSQHRREAALQADDGHQAGDQDEHELLGEVRQPQPAAHGILAVVGDGDGDGNRAVLVEADDGMAQHQGPHPVGPKGRVLADLLPFRVG